MPIAHLLKSTVVHRSPRVLQLEGMFEIPPTRTSGREWRVELPIEEREWQIGLIVGPSGCGKSTIARELFGAAVVECFEWPAGASIVDAFPRTMGVKEIAGLLSSVGFSSPPAWLRPFQSLSNGEQFRATLARALSEKRELAVIDEFTSVVDRTVAKIGSAAVAKAVRRSKGRLIAVTCHFDVIDWLQPDWIYEPATNAFAWRSLRCRPEIAIEVRLCRLGLWRWFERHHYLDAGLHPSAQCFTGLVDGEPAVFTAAIPFPHPRRPGWREHRTVCLPDFQGVGIGNALSDFVAGMYRATGKPYRSVTGNPAMIAHRARAPNWRMTRRPSRANAPTARRLKRTTSAARITASFEYVGPPRSEEARKFGVIK